MDVKKITDALVEFEKLNRIRIIYAVEHGSHRWGLASPKSDNDIGFIYVNPLDWYLRIGEHRDKQLESERDNFKFEIPGVGDFQGWDLRKTMNALHKGDPMLSEWLHAPESYLISPWYVSELKELFTQNFSELKYFQRSLSTAKKNFIEYVQNCDRLDDPEGYAVKKWMHTLRPLLSALYIEKFQRFPPAFFTALVHDLELPYGLDNHIRLLIDAKVRGVTDDVLTVRFSTLYDWMEGQITRLGKPPTVELSQPLVDITTYDAYFARTVKKINADYFEG